jgi:hypothetical protein
MRPMRTDDIEKTIMTEQKVEVRKLLLCFRSAAGRPFLEISSLMEDLEVPLQDKHLSDGTDIKEQDGELVTAWWKVVYTTLSNEVIKERVAEIVKNLNLELIALNEKPTKPLGIIELHLDLSELKP